MNLDNTHWAKRTRVRSQHSAGGARNRQLQTNEREAAARQTQGTRAHERLKNCSCGMRGSAWTMVMPVAASKPFPLLARDTGRAVYRSSPNPCAARPQKGAANRQTDTVSDGGFAPTWGGLSPSMQSAPARTVRRACGAAAGGAVLRRAHSLLPRRARCGCGGEEGAKGSRRGRMTAHVRSSQPLGATALRAPGSFRTMCSQNHTVAASAARLQAAATHARESVCSDCS